MYLKAPPLTEFHFKLEGLCRSGWSQKNLKGIFHFCNVLKIWKEQVLYKGERTALRLFLESGAQSAGTGPPGWAQNLGRAAKLFLALYIGVPTRLDYHLVFRPITWGMAHTGVQPSSNPIDYNILEIKSWGPKMKTRKS